MPAYNSWPEAFCRTEWPSYSGNIASLVLAIVVVTVELDRDAARYGKTA
jgi:hypothetical protein